VSSRKQAQTANSQADHTEHTVSDRQARRLIRLAKNFDKAVEALPDRGQKFKKEQKEVADTRRRAQMSEGLLRMRVK
jgi:Mn-dependent DtxR family transcriptional regulator